MPPANARSLSKITYISHQDQYPDDFNSLHELPDAYAWTNLNEHPSLDSSSSLEYSVPIIDLNDPNAIQLIGNACKSWGVFQVTNHGIPHNIVNDMESAARCLFCLPPQQKLKAARLPDGVSGYGFHLISAFCQKNLWSESFTIVGSPLEHFSQLWPQEYSKFCNIAEEYEKAMKGLASRLMWLILGSLGISKEDIEWGGPKGEFEEAYAILQLNSYPACPDPDRAMGLIPHTDSTLMSIVHQSNISGLQVFREGSGWVTVPPVSGAVVVNGGDLMHILSNGFYPSVLHRVLVNRAHHRVSVVCNYGPPDGVRVSPVPKLLGPSQPPLYPPVSWSEYVGTKAKLNDKALSSLRLYDPLAN